MLLLYVQSSAKPLYLISSASIKSSEKSRVYFCYKIQTGYKTDNQQCLVGYSLVENLIRILQDLLYNKIGLLVMYLFCKNFLLCFQMIFFKRPLLFEIIVYYQGVILNMFMHCFKSLIIILHINMC